MITERDLQEAIAECLGKKNPDASTCIKLAAFYTIRQELFPATPEPSPPSYSYAPGPVRDNIISVDSDSEFSRAVDGMKAEDVWPVIDELMETIKVIYPRLYNAVLAKF